MSQRCLCRRLRPNAPRTAEELLPLLCDLLVVSSPQLHERLRQDLDKLVIGAAVRKEFFINNTSLGWFSGNVTTRFDDTNLYRVLYDDGDKEDYDINELLSLLQINDDLRAQIQTANVDLVSVLQKAKHNKEADKYFPREKLCVKARNSPRWFGATLKNRRKLSVSLFKQFLCV